MPAAYLYESWHDLRKDEVKHALRVHWKHEVNRMHSGVRIAARITFTRGLTGASVSAASGTALRIVGLGGPRCCFPSMPTWAVTNSASRFASACACW